ncbi:MULTISPECIES: caspase family protein [unclassified Neorhizobium]|uniref:caspase family protein n=1 Tax=unclassified Neorhizobium TaxID=2629175 RepID=UPI001FF2877A|nr:MULTISPECIES: caspase family protein [unclassified Neorhizobium]MCJ9670329.1 caspase family protein [Neorhizobium sp. SHOUNA12B]MCJ9746584.1 caspase family protein [Neorhizobium sp. SHOUNA12A]
MTLIFESDAIKADPSSAVTHVLLIGCAEYPSLSKTAFGSLSSLTSPRVSVEAVANWFLTGVDAMPEGQGKGSEEAFFNDEAPLGSVVMLTSPSAPFKTPFGATITPERPSIDNIRTAYFEWVQRLALNSKSRGIFYYCGHGVSDGLTQQLVADDFGENKIRPFDAVFHLSNTVQGTIRKAKASLFYFIDACMELSQEIINQVASPQPLFDMTRTGKATTTEWAILRATTTNRLAYAPAGQVAYFTAALLSSLRGRCGIEHPSGTGYGIDVNRLRPAVAEFLDFTQPGDTDDRQKLGSTEGEGNGNVPMHVLTKRPSVLLELDIEPQGFRAIGQAFMESAAFPRDTQPLAGGPVQFIREHGEWTYGANSSDSTSFPEKLLARKLLTGAAMRRLINVET